MLKFIKNMIAKRRDFIVYIIFGVLTTLVNYIIFIPCRFMGLSAGVSNAISWVGAVVFAYLTNKPLVFHSNDWSPKTVFPELVRFAGCRLASFAAEEVILIVAVDLLKQNDLIWKIITSVLVVIANYFGSKLLVFKKKKDS